MSEFKGTPGPWEIMNGGDIFGPHGGDSGDGVACDSNDAWQVAEVGIYGAFVDGELVEMGNQPRMANMRLIAAAPEILEALQAAISYINESPCDPDITDKQAKAWVRLQNANPDLVISKALATIDH